MLPDKMAISHRNHLFVLVVFVFCLLSPLIQAEDADNYTDSRQLEKNLAVSRQRNNIQRLPNYNWKPPEHYGLREESTEKKAGMKFTKPEDPEQRIADPWIKKMQEISRQKREKWVPYKRNENEKLALDNVEETTRANKLTNDESITQLDSTILMTFAQTSMDQDNGNVKDFHDPSLLQFTDTNADGPNKKLDPWNISAENPFAEIIQEAPVMSHQRFKDYEISDIKEDLFDKQNMDYEKSELEEDRSFISKVNSHSKESISQESITQHNPNNPNNTRRNIKRYSNSDENLNYKDNNKESPVKEYPKQSDLSQSDKEESSKDSKRHDEKIVTTKPLTQKNKKERDDAEEKDTTERSLNHGGSFQSDTWGILSPPMEFPKDVFRQSTHRKNKKHTEGKEDERHDSDGRWDMSVASLSKEFLGDVLMHRTDGTEHLTVKPGSRQRQVKDTSHRRSLTHKSHHNLQADLAQRSTIDERNKEPAETLYKQVRNNFHHFQTPKLYYGNNYQTNVDLNNHLFQKTLKSILMQALQSYIEQNDIDIPIFCCCIQNPSSSFHT